MTSEPRRRSLWRVSLSDSDPLSWFTTPNLPLTAVGLTLVHSIVVLGPLNQAGSRPAVQLVAVGLAALSMLWVHVMTRPRRGPFTVGRVVVALTLGSMAFILSALGYSGEKFVLELWWAPLAFALLMFAMVPYSSAVRLAKVGAAVLAVSAAATVVLVLPDETVWPPFAAVAIVLVPTTIGAAGAVVMVRTITQALVRWSERPPASPSNDLGRLNVTGESLHDERLASAVDSATSERIAPLTAFITSVLERGVVTAGDAARSAALATRLRGELTGAVERTWIERVAGGRAVIVDDPERWADHLTVPQRTAVRALLDALVGPGPLQYGSARVELRRADSGAIAVSLRILSTLPEGRRETFLAPYYVSLRSTVDRLQWRTGPVTEVEFEVAVAARTRFTIQLTPEPGTPGGPVAR